MTAVSPESAAHPMKAMRVGILTGGGLAPGTNAVIAGIALLLKKYNHHAIGIPKGWAGFLEDNHSLIDFT